VEFLATSHHVEFAGCNRTRKLCGHNYHAVKIFATDYSHLGGAAVRGVVRLRCPPDNIAQRFVVAAELGDFKTINELLHENDWRMLSSAGKVRDGSKPIDRVYVEIRPREWSDWWIPGVAWCFARHITAKKMADAWIGPKIGIWSLLSTV
jgi:hypothetical protein